MEMERETEMEKDEKNRMKLNWSLPCQEDIVTGTEGCWKHLVASILFDMEKKKNTSVICPKFDT